MLHNKAMSNAVGLNMNGACINFAVLLSLLQAEDLRWEMSPAQLLSLEIQALIEPVAVVDLETKEDFTKELLKPTKYTILGIPVQLRKDYPDTWIRLYRDTTLVGYVENLAVPAVYSFRPDFGTYQKTQTEKAQKIWDTDNA